MTQPIETLLSSRPVDKETVIEFINRELIATCVRLLRAVNELVSRHALATTPEAGATPTIDWSKRGTAVIELDQNATPTFTAPEDDVADLTLVLGYTGAYTVTWPAEVVWASGTPPTLTSADGATDILTFKYINGTYFGAAYALDVA